MTNERRIKVSFWPSKRFMSDPDGLPILNTSTRYYFVRLLYGLSNRLFQLPYMGYAFVFDDEYLILSSGAVCGWDSKEEKPMKLPSGKTISALDFELLQMVKETAKKLEGEGFCKLQTVGGTKHININQACEILAQVHGE